jgi:hypothetical protein
MRAEVPETVWKGVVAGAEVKVMRCGDGENGEWLMVNVIPEGTPNSAILHINGRTAGFGYVNWQKAEEQVQEIAWQSMVDL